MKFDYHNSKIPSKDGGKINI
uniref:UORF n=1 Tax=Trypanosoma cruzi TaxID=5693 RepID=A0A076JRG5_TRYCR|nr:uORF [Trypanosoma cruzi]